MTKMNVSWLYAIAFFAALSTVALAGDGISQGDYALVKVVSRDGPVHPDLIQIHPARISRIDGRLIVEVSLFSTMRLQMKLFQGDGDNVVFFLTPDSSDNLAGSAFGEIYRGRLAGEDSIRGTFTNGESESGSFVLTKTKTVDTKDTLSSK